MLRSVLTVSLCVVAIVAGDTLFRTSLLQQLRPLILAPTEQAVLQPPVQVEWDGPAEMEVQLTVSGGEKRDLGLHTSPLTLHPDDFPREGGYRIDLRAPSFPDWINASRHFQVHGGPQVTPTPATAPEPAADHEPVIKLKDFLRALKGSRTSRDRAHQHAKFMSEENSALREENDRLAKQLETLSQAQEQDNQHTTDIERRLGQVGEEFRLLAEENAALRLRLSAVIPCTVWGYYSYPHPNTIPVTRRVLLVSDLKGQILRNQPECELSRRNDASAASLCFCVGSSIVG
jgi:regulator of replication initiation timing